jgi:L-fuconolactonase
MVIDSHQHFWNYDPLKFAWITDDMASIRRDFLPPELEQHLSRNKIDGCVAVQTDQAEDETYSLLNLAERFEFIKGVVGWVDLKRTDIDERLQHFKTFKKLKGFRHILQGEPAGFMTNGKFIAGVNQLIRYGFTYDLLIYHHQLGEALMFLSRVPGVKIVVDHIAKPPIRTGEINLWARQMIEVGTFDNVYCKLSGMVTEANLKSWTKEIFTPYMDKVFEIFGTSRVMYGSDWPVCLVAATYDEQLGIVTDYISQLSETEKTQVMGKNAETFYNLS